MGRNVKRNVEEQVYVTTTSAAITRICRNDFHEAFDDSVTPNSLRRGSSATARYAQIADSESSIKSATSYA